MTVRYATARDLPPIVAIYHERDLVILGRRLDSRPEAVHA